jgi:multiple sugar transport system permease protein
MVRSDTIKYVMIAPAVIVLAGTTLYPFVYAFFLSFQNWKLSRSPVPGPFIGFDNYIRAFNDVHFWNSVIVTLKFTVVSVALSIVIGLVMALLLQKSSRFNTVLRTLLIFPFAISPALKGFTWRFMLNPHFGILDSIIDFLFPPLATVVWLGGAGTALFWLAVTEVWGWAPFIALIFIGALDSMSQDPFDAAKVDGASALKTFRYVTLPMLRPIIVMVTLLKTIFSIKVFDQVVTLTGGGPGSSTETINYYVYKTGFKFFDMGYASAIAYLMVVVLFFLALLYLKTVMKEEV